MKVHLGEEKAKEAYLPFPSSLALPGALLSPVRPLLMLNGGKRLWRRKGLTCWEGWEACWLVESGVVLSHRRAWFSHASRKFVKLIFPSHPRTIEKWLPHFFQQSNSLYLLALSRKAWKYTRQQEFQPRLALVFWIWVALCFCGKSRGRRSFEAEP